MTLPQVATFRAADGRELAYLAYHPADAAADAPAFVYLHGIESHAGWFDAAARGFNARGFPVFCLDRRGSGINRENRGCPSGHVERGVDLLDDVHAAIRAIRGAHPARATHLIGLSWGGKYAMAYEARHPGSVDGLVLVTPGIKPKIDLPPWEKLAVAIEMLVAPDRRHHIPIEPEMFTTTPRHLDFIRRDPLRLRSVSAAFLWQSRRLDRLLARPRRPPHPRTLVFLAGRDRIIDNHATRRFFGRQEDREVTIVEYADQTHSLQLDAAERMIDDVLAWMGAGNQIC